MRILISAFACLPNSGSESQQGWGWVSAFAAAGHTVHVLTRRTNQQRIEDYLAEAARDPSRIAECAAYERIHFEYVDVPYPRFIKPSTSGIFYLAWQVTAWRMARRLVRKYKFDFAQHVSYGAVHVPSPLALLPLPLVYGPGGGGQVTAKGLFPFLGDYARKERFRNILIEYLPLSPIHRLLLRRTAMVLATNQETMRMARRCGCRRVHFLLDTGLRDSSFTDSPKAPGARQVGEPASQLRLAWVGSDRPRKGLLLALDAMKRVTADVHLTIITSSGADRIARLTQARGLGNRVSTCGPVPWSEMPRLYELADCMLFTSIRDSFGSQLLEAAAQALPIVCLDQHGAKEFVTDAMGIRVPPTTAAGTAAAVARAIDRFAEMSPEVRLAMSAASLERARLSTWPNKIATALDLYQSFLEPSSAALSPINTGKKPAYRVRQSDQPEGRPAETLEM